jgi:hypothetical protein
MRSESQRLIRENVKVREREIAQRNSAEWPVLLQSLRRFGERWKGYSFLHCERSEWRGSCAVSAVSDSHYLLSVWFIDTENMVFSVWTASRRMSSINGWSRIMMKTAFLCFSNWVSVIEWAGYHSK